MSSPGEYLLDQSDGTKHDTDKPRWDLLPYGALEEVVKVYTFGANKYDDWNWSKGIQYSRLMAALMRHLFKWWWKRESIDEETKCHHLASVVFNALGLLHFELQQQKQLDNRK